jgi:hypothetical protein
MAAMLRAGLSRLDGDEHAARQALGEAARQFAAVEMHGAAAVARRRAGDDDPWFVAQRIADPARWCALFAPID